jgi:hypothetical protein
LNDISEIWTKGGATKGIRRVAFAARAAADPVLVTAAQSWQRALVRPWLWHNVFSSRLAVDIRHARAATIA